MNDRQQQPTHGERLTALETALKFHMRSCDRKGSIQIALLIAIMGALMSGMGVHFLGGGLVH